MQVVFSGFLGFMSEGIIKPFFRACFLAFLALGSNLFPGIAFSCAMGKKWRRITVARRGTGLDEGPPGMQRPERIGKISGLARMHRAEGANAPGAAVSGC